MPSCMIKSLFSWKLASLVSHDTHGDHGPLAHLVERLLCTQKVTGSSPVGSTKRNIITMSNVETKKELPPEQREQLFKTLKARFEKNMNRHKGLEWAKIQAKLETLHEKLWSLNEMERTGGEPDVVAYHEKTAVTTKRSIEYIFYDCSTESPKGRRSFCYDREAMEARKKHKPKYNALDLAEAMGIDLLTETQYRALQKLGTFDTKTSSWLKTPPEIRKLGGAIFADFRYGNVFVYHNGAESYYASRGFRGELRV